MNINELIRSEELQLQRLQELVNDAVKEERLLSDKLLEAERDENSSFGQNLADKIAEFGGSWAFILFSLRSFWFGLVATFFFCTKKFLIRIRLYY